MIGAIAGDVIGSRFEGSRARTPDFEPLLGFEWVTLGKHSNHPIVRPGRPSLRPDLAA